MNKRQIKAAVSRASFDRYVEVALYQETDEGESVFSGAPIEFRQVQVGAYAEPTLRLRRDEAQELMDALWSAGLRPTEGSGSAGALAATQAHLQDMRKLVFNKANERGGKC